MARGNEIASSLPGQVAQNIVGSCANSLTAVGTNLATALSLPAAVNRITTAAASTGVALLPGELPGTDIWIVNDNTGQTITVYTQTGETFINGATSKTLATNTTMICKKVSNTVWMTITSA